MIFVDTNVFMYAVGRPHPLRDHARQFFYESQTEEPTTPSLAMTASMKSPSSLSYRYLRVFLAPGGFLARGAPSRFPAEGSVAPRYVVPATSRHRAFALRL